MKITTKSEYACLSLIELSRNYGKDPISVESIASKYGISEKYLEQILLQIKRNGYLKSYRGYNGGYILNKQPGEINLAEILRLMDGPIAPYNCVSEIECEDCAESDDCRLKEVWGLLRTKLLEVLENITFADLLKEDIDIKKLLEDKRK
jgi:Rrf2 family protein